MAEEMWGHITDQPPSRLARHVLNTGDAEYAGVPTQPDKYVHSHSKLHGLWHSWMVPNEDTGGHWVVTRTHRPEGLMEEQYEHGYHEEIPDEERRRIAYARDRRENDPTRLKLTPLHGVSDITRKLISTYSYPVAADEMEERGGHDKLAVAIRHATHVEQYPAAKDSEDIEHQHPDTSFVHPETGETHLLIRDINGDRHHLVTPKGLK